MPRVLRWFLKTLLVLAVILFAAAIAFYFRPGKFFAGLHWLGYKLAGVHSKYAIFDSYRIHYLETGVGAPLVLVHGLGGSADDWATYLPALAKSGYHVYAPDLLGFGDSQKPDVDYSIALQTKVFSDFLDVQKLDRPDMGGWSMGGWIVLEFARLNPQRVRRLMVFDSAGLKYGQAPPESVLSPTTPEDLSKMEALLTPHPKPLPNFIARDVLRTIAANDWVVR
ncbi:MAG: alpha/beta fold hydrolase, partial [Candidatus Acidiferrales bacterium]